MKRVSRQTDAHTTPNANARTLMPLSQNISDQNCGGWQKVVQFSIDNDDDDGVRTKCTQIEIIVHVPIYVHLYVHACIQLLNAASSRLCANTN